MNHNSLCPQSPGKELVRQCFYCELISKARKDERRRWDTPWYSVEYHRGYRDAKSENEGRE